MPRKLIVLVLSGCCFLLQTSAGAVVNCYDYALVRAAERQGIAGCDPTPPKAAWGHYLSPESLRSRLTSLGYQRISGDDSSEFGQRVFELPGFAESFLLPGDVVLLRGNHAGFVTKGAKVDHFIQAPGDSGKRYAIGKLPKPITRSKGYDEPITGGFFEQDTIIGFLKSRSSKYATGNSFEVWRADAPLNTDTLSFARKEVCSSDSAGSLTRIDVRCMPNPVQPGGNISCRAIGIYASNEMSQPDLTGHARTRWGNGPNASAKGLKAGQQIVVSATHDHIRGSATVQVTASPDAAGETSCDLYATDAVRQFNLSRDRNCGYSGLRWHGDYQLHYRWCLKEASPGQAGEERNIRASDLAKCSKR